MPAGTPRIWSLKPAMNFDALDFAQKEPAEDTEGMC